MDGSLQQQDWKELLQGDFFGIGPISLNTQTSTQAADLELSYKCRGAKDA